MPTRKPTRAQILKAAVELAETEGWNHWALGPLADHMGAAVNDIRKHFADPNAITDVAKVGLTFRFHCNDPAGEIWIDGRQSPPATSFGPGTSKVDLDVTLSADTLHEILLGRLFLVKALGAKKLQVKGPLMKAKALADVFAASKQIYPEILREKGIG